jgi:hypothetical protein
MVDEVAIEEALESPDLLGAGLGDLSTWTTWIATVKAAYGRPLTEAELEAFAGVSGGRKPPTRKVRELDCVVSRRAGKGRLAGALAVYESAIVDHRDRLSPGEKAVVACISPTRAQAEIVKNYALGFFEASPVLRGEVAGVTQDEIRLRNGNVICTLSSDHKHARGRSLSLAILDEASFLPQELSATPDIEAARGLLPGLSTLGGMLCVLSSPYRQAGLLHQRYRDWFGKDSDDMLVVSGASTVFNPTLDPELIRAAYESDGEAASAEWGGLFRNDLATYVDLAAVRACIQDEVRERLPDRQWKYIGFCDPSGGSSDSMVLCVGHRSGETSILDVIREVRPPFNPESVCEEFADILKQYRVTKVVGDAYGGDFHARYFGNSASIMR